jgi:hypothetical protein
VLAGVWLLLVRELSCEYKAGFVLITLKSVNPPDIKDKVIKAFCLDAYLSVTARLYLRELFRMCKELFNRMFAVAGIVFRV